MTGEILIFGGTTEGRQVSAYLSEKKQKHTLCVATKYGEEVLDQNPFLTVHTGRMGREEISAFLRKKTYALIVDATHPYAAEASENIRTAASAVQVPYLRYLRPKEEEASKHPRWDAGSLFVDSAEEAAEYLENQKGSIFLTTGSKELPVFVKGISDISRLSVRILPSREALESCRALGLSGKQIFAMQGPFSTEMNAAMLRQTQAAFLVTKESGEAGGFPEKIKAASMCRVQAVVIRRPEEVGASWEEVRDRIDALISGGTPVETADRPAADLSTMDRPAAESPAADPSTANRPAADLSAANRPAADLPNVNCPVTEFSCRVSCVGIGMGSADTLTREAAQAILEADVIFGARRMLACAQELLEKEQPAGEQGQQAGFQQPAEALQPAWQKKPVLVPEYDAGKILSRLRSQEGFQNAVILMSGDVGFYSGAQQIREKFPPGAVRYLCGVSSVSYFASMIPTAWQDAVLLSAHAQEPALLNQIKKYPKIFLLAGSAKDVERLCRQLMDAGMDQVSLTVGKNLSYPDEEIRQGSPADFCSYPKADLPIVLIENPKAGQIVTPGIPDAQFVRGQVPMTKEEIRILAVSKLRLKEDSVVFDVGAGTGSVAAECARLCTNGQVYAIERNPEGIRLIGENSQKIGVSNLKAVLGTAPEILKDLPAPTHAFIGGSSGKMAEIIQVLLQMNPSVRIVISAVTMETIAEVVQILKNPAFSDAEILQIFAAKSRSLGEYHLMAAQNPVYLISFGGEENDG